MTLDCVSVVGAQLQYLGRKRPFALEREFANEFAEIIASTKQKKAIRQTIQYAADLMKDGTLRMSRLSFVRLLLAIESLRQEGVEAPFPKGLQFLASMPMSQLSDEQAGVLIVGMNMMAKEDCEGHENKRSTANGRA